MLGALLREGQPAMQPAEHCLPVCGCGCGCPCPLLRSMPPLADPSARLARRACIAPSAPPLGNRAWLGQLGQAPHRVTPCQDEPSEAQRLLDLGPSKHTAAPGVGFRLATGGVDVLLGGANSLSQPADSEPLPEGLKAALRAGLESAAPLFRMYQLTLRSGALGGPEVRSRSPASGPGLGPTGQ